MEDLSRWESLRKAMPIAQKWAYFDHAAVAPLPSPTHQALSKWALEATDEGGMTWGRWRQRVEDCRNLAAEMIAADATEIALVANTTTGINFIADSLQWEVGDNVVTFDNEFPSNQYPWMNLADRGVELRRVPFTVPDPLTELAAACDSHTRLISVSWVGYASGWRLDLDELTELAQRHRAMTFVDAIQGMGVFPINTARTRIDFLAADGHKWMLGPEGAGLLYIRKAQLERLRPRGIGWNSVRQGHDFSTIALDLVDGACRYEGGSYNMAGIHGLASSLELLKSLGAGPDESLVGERIVSYVSSAADELQRAGCDLRLNPEPSRSGILSFTVPNRDPVQLRKKCLRHNVAISCRDGRLRISPHAYNNEQDLERLVEVITDSD